MHALHQWLATSYRSRSRQGGWVLQRQVSTTVPDSVHGASISDSLCPIGHRGPWVVGQHCIFQHRSNYHPRKGDHLSYKNRRPFVMPSSWKRRQPFRPKEPPEMTLQAMHVLYNGSSSHENSSHDSSSSHACMYSINGMPSKN